jgi:hypothetical protein
MRRMLTHQADVLAVPLNGRTALPLMASALAIACYRHSAQPARECRFAREAVVQKMLGYSR